MILQLSVIFGGFLTLTVSAPTSTTVSVEVPYEFPSTSDQNYRFLENSTVREGLLRHDTEVSDLLEKIEDDQETNATAASLPTKEKGLEEIESKSDTEWIENGEDTEDDKFQQKTTEIDVKEFDTLETYEQGVALIDGTVAAVLVGIFLMICVFGYAGLILWRKSLEAKYGSREMLVDDDIFDPDDMKHFSI